MKSLIFEQPSINKKFSNSEIHTIIFKGMNISNFKRKVKGMGVSCPCLTFDKIEVLEGNSEFEVKTYLNKIGQKGFFSVRLTIKLDNDETHTLTVAGELQSDNT